MLNDVQNNNIFFNERLISGIVKKEQGLPKRVTSK